MPGARNHASRAPSLLERPASAFLAIALVTFGVYGLSFWAPLIYDDEIFILKRAKITGPWPGWSGLLLDAFTNQKVYEPLPFLIHRLIFGLAGGEPFFYRLTSLLLHWFNTILLLRLLERLLRDRLLALAAAVLFCVFPAHAEVVAISTFKTHLFVGFFCLLLLNLQAYAGRMTFFRAALGWLAFALALLCKESALIIPFLSLLLAWTFCRMEGKAFKPDAVFYGGLLSLLLAYILMRWLALPRHYPPLIGGGWLTHLLTSAKCFLWYAGQSLIPWNPCLEHSLAPVAQAAGAEGLAVAAVTAAALGGLLLAQRRDAVAGAGLAWAFLCLTPFLNVIPFLNYSLVADRYLYLSSAGFMLFWARGLQAFLFSRGRRRQGPILAAFALPLLIAYAAKSGRALAAFGDPARLWSETVRCAPTNPRAHGALGLEHMKVGRWPAAIAEFRQALRLDPAYWPARLDLALSLSKTGRLDEAIAITKAEAENNPTFHAWNNLGIFHLESGRARDAASALERAARMASRPQDSRMVDLNLGLCDLSLGRWAGAEERLLSAAEFPETRRKALNGLGRLYAQTGRPRLAETRYLESLSLSYLQPEIIKELAVLYAGAGRHQEARRLYQEAIEGLKGEIRRHEELAARIGFDAAKEADEILNSLERGLSGLKAGPR